MDHKKAFEVELKDTRKNHKIIVKALNVTEVVKQVKEKYDTEIISIKRRF